MDTPWDRTVLGVDQSLTSTAMVVGGNGEVDHIDVFLTKPDKTDDLADYKRCKAISDKVLSVANHFMVDMVYIEGLSFNAPGSSNRQLAGLLYTIVINLLEAGFEVQVVAPTSLKKHAVGKGNAKKDQMIEALPDFMKDALEGYPKKSRDDIADAYWLSQYT